LHSIHKTIGEVHVVRSTLAIRCLFAVLIGFAVFSFSSIPSHVEGFDRNAGLETTAQDVLSGMSIVRSHSDFTSGSDTLASLESHHSELIEESEEKIFDSLDLPQPAEFVYPVRPGKIEIRLTTCHLSLSVVSLPLRC